MNCALCNGEVVKQKGSFPFKSKTLGMLSIPNISFEECQSCGDKLLSPQSSEKVLKYVREKEQEAIDSMPIRDFISASEAAEILGITKQAFSKHPRIKRGLIYSATKGKRKLFIEKSVKLFKNEGNGKFLLPQAQRYDQLELTKPAPTYILIKYVEGTNTRSSLQNGRPPFGFDPNIVTTGKQQYPPAVGN